MRRALAVGYREKKKKRLFKLTKKAFEDFVEPLLRMKGNDWNDSCPVLPRSMEIELNIFAQDDGKSTEATLTVGAWFLFFFFLELQIALFSVIL